MSFQKKYSCPFKGITNNSYRIEIWENDKFPVTSGSCTGMESPFVVNYSDVSKLEPIHGSGCQISLLSDTNMKFLDLYTADIQEYQIRFYIDSDLMWCGYMDTEIYEEQFSETTNYPVSFSGNDGFALLDRMYYLGDEGGKSFKFTGITSQWEVLTYILGKINLPFTSYNIGLSTTISGVSFNSNETIFHKTYVINSNFYNEDGDSETLRTILESILQPYGAFIIQRNGSIYITDIQSIINSYFDPFYEIDFKQYVSDYSNNSSSFTGITYVSFNPQPVYIGDLSNIKFTSSEQQLSIISAYNKEIVKYSPYMQVDIMDYDASDDLYTSAGFTYQYGTIPYRWKETDFTSKVWDNYGLSTFTKLEGIDNLDEIDYYMINRNSGYTILNFSGLCYSYKAELPTTIPSNYKLKISLSGYFRNTDNLNDETYVPDLIKSAELYVEIIIGNKKYCNTDVGWFDVSDSSKAFLISFEKAPIGSNNGITTYSPIEDEWIDSGYYTRTNTTYKKVDYLIPLSGSNCAQLKFNICGYLTRNLLNNYQNVIDARFKDIKITVVDSDGNDVSEVDIEYVGYMDERYKSEGDTIDLIQGTNLNDFPVERGGLLGYNGSTYYWLKNWTKNGLTDNIENLLLRSFVGNYQTKSLQLSCTTNRITGVLGFITYENYLYGNIFMPVGITIDYAEETSELVLQEIFTDSLTINKSW